MRFAQVKSGTKNLIQISQMSGNDPDPRVIGCCFAEESQETWWKVGEPGFDLNILIADVGIPDNGFEHSTTVPAPKKQLPKPVTWHILGTQ